MGFFSWKTSDTKRSIANRFSGKATFTVYMKTEDGRVWKEDNYEGYGVFGGKDFYVLIAELNWDKIEEKDKARGVRNIGMDLAFQENNIQSLDLAASRGIKFPKLFENEDSKYEDYPFPKRCEYQGYFYDD